MIISLLVLSRDQIIVAIMGKHGSLYRGPITLLEQLVVLIGRHKDMLVKRSNEKGEGKGVGKGKYKRIGSDLHLGMT